MNRLPLPALVGLEAAQQALLLLAVEPGLRGLVLAAPAGTGKSSLARGFQALLDDGAPFVELPTSADEEGLLGGLDMEATLRTGSRVVRAGALARADGGVVAVDGLNLLPDSSANLLLAALDSGEVRLEREGLSQRLPADFTLIGAYDPAEGTPRRHLLDRVGLLVVLPATADAEQRAEVVRRNRTTDDGRWTMDDGRWTMDDGRRAESVSSSSVVRRSSAWSAWAEELAVMRALVRAAREQLPTVAITDEQLASLASAALAFGVEGQRADLFAARAACAAAALDGRDEVEPADLELAVRLVVLPRATRMPEPRTEEREPRTEEREPRTEEREPDTEDETSNPQAPVPDPQSPIPDEQVLEALATELPADLAALPFTAVRRGRAGSRGSTSGSRGRHVRSTPGDPRRKRIDIAATLRAAAPWQRLRTKDERRKTKDERSDSPGEVTLFTTADPAFVHRPSSIALQANDLRVKHFRSKAGALFCFAVDASGSMALNRMRQAKGAVHALLQQAYIHRDRVALLAFRGQRADLLLPPSQSVELARRALDLLPTGGGTPLAAALLAALDVAQLARGKGIMQTVLVLLTDGRANVGLRAERSAIADEVRQIAGAVAAAGIKAIVVDTQRSYLSRGEARRLAEWLGGQYIYLPNASGAQIASAALAASET